MNYPKEFENLIDSFRRLPGVGYKSAERMAYQILEMKEEYRDKFVESLNGVSSLKKCEICHNLTSGDKCDICSDINRDTSLICVVQSIKDVFAIEKSNSFNGLYHVLDGVISVKQGKLPEYLNIEFPNGEKVMDACTRFEEFIFQLPLDIDDVLIVAHGALFKSVLEKNGVKDSNKYCRNCICVNFQYNTETKKFSNFKIL